MPRTAAAAPFGSRFCRACYLRTNPCAFTPPLSPRRFLRLPAYLHVAGFVPDLPPQTPQHPSSIRGCIPAFLSALHAPPLATRLHVHACALRFAAPSPLHHFPCRSLPLATIPLLGCCRGSCAPAPPDHKFGFCGRAPHPWFVNTRTTCQNPPRTLPFLCHVLHCCAFLTQPHPSSRTYLRMHLSLWFWFTFCARLVPFMRHARTPQVPTLLVFFSARLPALPDRAVPFTQHPVCRTCFHHLPGHCAPLATVRSAYRVCTLTPHFTAMVGLRLPHPI